MCDISQSSDCDLAQAPNHPQLHKKGNFRTAKVMDIIMTDKNSPSILVGMSGGLDSTYTAYRYREMGYRVYGAVLRMSAETDVSAAQTAAEQVGIPLEIIDAQAAFDRYVKDYFAASYANGKTPNPCVECNRRLKFRCFFDKAVAIGYDGMATGHYAQVAFDSGSGRYLLKKAVDRAKDQTYFLYSLTQDILSHTLLPLGGMTKPQIREIAAENGFIGIKFGRQFLNQRVVLLIALVLKTAEHRKNGRGEF
jgi:tRNA U34 2-thiouridine synthase MnmA/TrmU